MECRTCASPLDRPGDYCLVCRSENADAVVLDLDRERAAVSTLLESDVVGERIVTTRPETDPELAVAELRNFAGLVADEVRRKRPDDVYAAGDREVLRAVRADLHYPLSRVAEEDPVGAVLESRDEQPLEVVEASPAEKLGGVHTTLIGGRAGRRAVRTIATHPHVKKVVPGPIDGGGGSTRSGVRAKATRADENGNVRLLLREGSSVQTTRVITTARDRDLGERVRSDLDDSLREDDLRD